MAQSAFASLINQILLQQLMDAEKRQPVALYEVPVLPELEVKSLIIKGLPEAQLSPEHITLRKKEGKYQAYLMVPPGKVDEVCIKKTMLINKESVPIKKPFFEAQVFIGRIPDSLSIDEIRTFIEADYGKITKIPEGQPHEGTKSKLKHCYVQFENAEDAEKFLFTPKKIIIKGHQLRPSRAYTMTESDETDKKLFLKINSQYEDQDDLERVLNDEFRKEGKLRQKIRVENGKATIVYTSATVADKVLHDFKGGKIGKYEVVLRPFANKDSYVAFVGGLKPTVTQQDIEKAFAHYQPMISCTLLKGNNQNPRNATLTFASKDIYNRLLVEYKEDPLLKDVFGEKPHATQHMSAKDRNDYNQFRKGKAEKKPMPNQMLTNPVNLNAFGTGPMQGPFVPPPLTQMGRPPGNYPMSSNFYPPQM